MPVQDLGEGGSETQNVRSLLPVSSPDSPIIWRGDMGGDPEDWKAPGDLPTQTAKKTGRYATSETERRDLALPSNR